MSPADYDLHDDDARLEPEFRVIPRSFVSTLESSAGLSPSVARALCTQIFTAIRDELANTGMAIIFGFGTFRYYPWRSRSPQAPHPLWSPVELPFPGPVEFRPAQTLLLQLDEGVLNTRTVFTADNLLPTLREVPGLPPAASGQILRVIFLILTDLLLVEHTCTLPGLGTFTRTRKVTYPQVDPTSGVATPRLRYHVRFAASAEILSGLPSTFRTPQVEMGTPGEFPLATLLAIDPEGELSTPSRDTSEGQGVNRVPPPEVHPVHSDADLPEDPEGI